MKVLFVSSGKSGDVGYVVRNQGESLIRYGVEVEYFTITPGLAGYIRSVGRIRQTIREGGYDLIHAHYSFSAFAASLAGAYPLVVSLMGSDAFKNDLLKRITKILSKRRWSATIVKTDEMKRRLKLDTAHIIPNGVDMERFVPVGKTVARQRLGILEDKKIVLFIAVKNRPEKNISLAKEAVDSLNYERVEFVHLFDTRNSEVAYYLNAADLMLLTSSREGGVNVIKEAMACNCPIVSTDVGDVKWVTSGTKGCFITQKDCRSIAEGIRQALNYRERTNGRERIFELGLDSASVARKIIKIYQSALLKHYNEGSDK
jgi:teichuronic acid biosynthesis glycosyltransferase TuaC